MEITKKQHPEPILTLKLAVLLGVAVAFCLPAIVLAVAPFEDSFEDYILGNLAGNNGWTEEMNEKWQVNWDITPPDGVKSVSCGTLNTGCRATRTGDLVETGSWTIDFYIPSDYHNPNERLVVFGLGSTYVWSWKANFNGTACKIWKAISIADFTEFGEFTCDAWHSVSVEWRPIEIRFRLDDEDWTEWQSTYSPFSGVDRIYLDSYSEYEKYYVDNLNTELPELRVFVVSPASGGTATSTEGNFIVGWEGWDFEDIYKDFVFSFYEKNTGILTGTKIFEPTTEAGTTTLNFLNFGFNKNGKYYFHAKARSPLVNYTAYYTGDLVLPEWWLNLEIEGWEAIFEMPEFTTWYSEHSKFATPTTGFLTITNFLTPIYNKLGEFGSRVVEFLDTEEAYDRGYSLGIIIPTYKNYISGIEVFFGGFPIMTIFTSFLAILLGIFIGRLILKFIPGLG
jgi:hypothetical protein